MIQIKNPDFSAFSSSTSRALSIFGNKTLQTLTYHRFRDKQAHTKHRKQPYATSPRYGCGKKILKMMVFRSKISG
ncbi:MAG TPA: hypothetical protein DCE42_04195 [Myxococcales bacterium]|nr:hypothetical protein [Deltaproteobacteria bacterium]MBU47684.1 hypothetical protein [Deltaproteobacteria bacterium]HAA53927.1 hypothetical protein [Myxococcales bacterium]